MAERGPKSSNVQDLSVDMGSVAEAKPAPVLPDNQQDLAAFEQQLMTLIRQGIHYGMLTERADGSLLPPARLDPRQERFDRIGSDCECPRCTPYNQHHYHCAGCLNGPFEYTTQPPKAPPIQIGIGNNSYKKYEFCSGPCAQVFRERQRLGRPSQAHDNVQGLGDIPVAGGDDGFGVLTGRG